MLNVLIYDNDIQFIEYLKNQLLTNFHDQFINLNFSSFTKEISGIYQKGFDIYFIGIDTLYLDGIEIAHKIKQNYVNALIIYITSFDDLVFLAMKTHPYDFIRKKHFINEFSSKIEDFILKVKSKQKNYFFRYNNIIKSIPWRKIYYFQKSVNNLFIKIENKHYTQRRSINSLICELPINFVQLDSATIVNVEHIKVIQGDKLYLCDGTSFTISRRRLTVVKNAYIKFIQ